MDCRLMSTLCRPPLAKEIVEVLQGIDPPQGFFQPAAGQPSSAGSGFPKPYKSRPGGPCKLLQTFEGRWRSFPGKKYIGLL